MELSTELAQSVIASQAELIRRLQTELAELQIDHEIILVNYQNLQDNHTKYVEEIRSGETAKYAKRIAKLEAALASAESKIVDIAEERNQAERTIARQGELIRRLQTELNDLDSELNAAKHEIAHLADVCAGHTARTTTVAELESALAEEKNVHAANRSHIQTLRERRDKDCERITELETMVAARDKALVELATDATTAENRVSELTHKLARAQLANTAKDQRLEEAKQYLTKLEQCLAKRNARITELERRLAPRTDTKSS